MTRVRAIGHEFVDFIPDELSEATLYISIPYATTVHQCLCGCGHRVITPLSPTDWELTFDGRTVSLDPSIGNWNFDCQSHYWIERGRVHWAERWSQKRIDANRAGARRAKARFFEKPADADPRSLAGGATAPMAAKTGWISRLLRRLRR